ncbi:hypothetical protein ISN45_Aa05g010600 [Arabidopsis thaliana x Arabidopsis arenosa]|uniref:Transmembrane protein n=1 Tax=Arabidopsis thaliana x Arabidopsis arenosa TaxID=1240361 RepID=A0A8T1ZLU9_9BRAS|nr:hypothetical protein ISN45_Aa05g010600 [Arabidopsis thaliana x Arabidopsis arenosa]
MAHRRRDLSPRCYCCCSSVSLSSSAQVWFQERTSSFVSSFAQSRRRRFTELKSGVSLRFSDADLFSVFYRRPVSIHPSTSVGSSFEDADLPPSRKSLDMAVGDPGSSQIRRACSPTTATLLVFVVHVPSVVFRRSQSLVASFSGARFATSLHWPSSSTDIGCVQAGDLYPDPVFTPPFSHNHSFSLVAGATLGFQVLGLVWALQVMGQILVNYLTGLSLLLQPASPLAPLSTTSSFLIRGRLQLGLPLATLVCCFPQPPTLHGCFSNVDCDWWIRLGCLCSQTMLMSRSYLVIVFGPLLLWSFFVEHPLLHSSDELPRYQNSFCWGQERSFSPSSFSKERTLSPLSTYVLFWSLYRCPCVVRSALVCEGRSEASLSVISKGYAIWCYVAFAPSAGFRLVFPALVAVSSSNIRSPLVVFVLHGVYSLLVSNVVKVQGRQDNVFSLSVRFACIYPCFFSVYVLCSAIVAAMLVALLAWISWSVTVSPLAGEF